MIKALADYPGHFVVGIIGQQGVGKSTILSHFTPDPINVRLLLLLLFCYL